MVEQSGYQKLLRRLKEMPKPPREDRRVIAIQMLPKAYTEIQRLKGEETWTKFIIECVLAKVGDNAILKDELAGLIAEAEARKVKAEKPKTEKPIKKAKAEKKAEAPKVEPRTLPASTETSTPAMRQLKKGKTLQELQAVNK